jgi:quercetin dioxygenase-like cupin family protein
MKKNLFGVFILGFALSFGASAQHAGKSSEVTQVPPKVIFKRIINTKEIKNQEVKMVLVTFAPGEASQAHRHPIPTMGYVLEGEIASTFEGKTHIYKKGDTFWEEPNGLHNSTRNLSKTKPAKLLAYFIGNKEQPFLVPEKK